MAECVPRAGKEITARVTTDKEVPCCVNTKLTDVVIEKAFHIVLKRGDVCPCGNEMCHIRVREGKLRNIFGDITPQATRVVAQSIGLGVERHVAVLGPEQTGSEIHRHILERAGGTTISGLAADGK